MYIDERLLKILETHKGETVDVNFMISLIKTITKEYETEQLRVTNVSNRLLAEKIILALDDYGREVHPAEYGLPIDPDTKDFEDEEPQEMLKIVTDILNGC